ncbi:MAG: anti-sigma F factor [Eubacteriales bacterium]|nr:anti-sigma F factor [Eubacteriales bacterium]
MENRFDMEFIGISENESLARAITSAFAAMLDPTVEELSELKTAVSEAVTNAIVHAYPYEPGTVGLSGKINGNTVYITVTDSGIGISDIDKAREPLYTGKPEEERSGLGFSIMESFCDRIEVMSALGEGTMVTLVKSFGSLKGES